jgi:hypothetical protein
MAGRSPGLGETPVITHFRRGQLSRGGAILGCERHHAVGLGECIQRSRWFRRDLDAETHRAWLRPASTSRRGEIGYQLTLSMLPVETGPDDHLLPPVLASTWAGSSAWKRHRPTDTDEDRAQALTQFFAAAGADVESPKGADSSLAPSDHHPRRRRHLVLTAGDAGCITHRLGIPARSCPAQANSLPTR